MTEESKEHHLRPSKVLTFFNYPKAIAALELQLQALEQDYRKLIGSQDAAIQKEAPPTDQLVTQQNKDALQKQSSRKRFVVVDQNKVIESLRAKIDDYQKKIGQLAVKNQTQLTKISVLGWLPDGSGQLIFNMLDKNSNIGPFVQSGGVIGVDFRIAMLTDYHKLQIWFFAEQTRFDVIVSSYLRGQHITLIFFDLNEHHFSEESFEVAKRRIRNHYFGNGKMIVMLGLHKPGIPEKKSLELFNRFREEECVEHFFICEETDQGKDALREFLVTQIANLTEPLRQPYKLEIASTYALRSKAFYSNDQLYNCLKWADQALKEDPHIFSRVEKLEIPNRISVLKVISTDDRFNIDSLIDCYHPDKAPSFQRIPILKVISNDTNTDFSDFSNFNEITHVDYNKWVYTNKYVDIQRENIIDQSDAYHTIIHFREYFIFNKNSSDFLESTSSDRSKARLLNCPNEPILHIATRLGFQRLVKWLIVEGTDVNIKSEDGRTAVMIAIFYGYKDLADFLIDQGADITIVTNHRATCLSLAVKSLHVYEIYEISYLCDLYQDHELLIAHINEAMIQATAYNKLTLFKDLLARGGNIHHQDTQGRSLLFIATHCSHAIAKFLLEEYPELKNSIDFFPSAIETAISINDYDMIQLLVKHGFNLSTILSNNKPALLQVILTGSLEIIKFMFENGADIRGLPNLLEEYIDEKKKMSHSDSKILKYLITTCKIDLECLNSSHQTPLMIAALKKNQGLTRALAQRGANIAHHDNQGITAVYFALAYSQLDLALYLFTAASKTNRQDLKSPRTVFQEIDATFFDIVRLLAVKGTDIQFTGNDHTVLSLKQVAENCLQLMKAPDFQVNTSTALTRACKEGDIKMVECLIQTYDYDVNREALPGEFPLTCAAKYPRIFMYLLNCRADFNQCVNDGSSILTWAVDQGHHEIVELLLNRDATLKNKLDFFPHLDPDKTFSSRAVCIGHFTDGDDTMLKNMLTEDPNFKSNSLPDKKSDPIFKCQLNQKTRLTIYFCPEQKKYDLALSMMCKKSKIAFLFLDLSNDDSSRRSYEICEPRIHLLKELGIKKTIMIGIISKKLTKKSLQIFERLQQRRDIDDHMICTSSEEGKTILNDFLDITLTRNALLQDNEVEDEPSTDKCAMM